MKSILTLSLVLGLALVPAAWSQSTLTIGTGSLQNTNTTWPAPYGNWYSGARQQYLIPASELSAAGLNMGQITAVGFDVASVQGTTLMAFEIKMALSTAPDLSAGWDAGPFTTVLNPTTYSEVAGWNTHVLDTPFNWDGSSNLVLELCFWNGANSYTNSAVVNQSATAYASSRVAYSDSAPSCGGTAPGSVYLQRPDIQLSTLGPVLTEWQVNSPEASLDIDGALVTNPHGVGGYAIARGHIMNLSHVNIGSVLTGTPHDIMFGTAPLVPQSAGAYPTPGGQLINMDVTDPTLSFLFGAGSVPGLPIFPGNYSLPVISGVPVVGAGQAVFANPAHPDGLSLSQACRLEILSGVSATVTGDDTLQNVALANPISFYGQTFNSIDVSTNGWIKFGANATSSDLSESADDFVGGLMGSGTPAPGIAVMWEDLDMGNRPTSMVQVTELGPGILQVQWIDGDLYPSTPFGTVTCLVDSSGGAGVPVRVTLDYSGYTAAPTPTEGLVGVSDGGTALAVASAVDLVAGGAVNPYPGGQPVETIFQSFDGVGTVVPPLALETYDLGGLVLTFDDLSGLGSFLMY